MKIKYEFATGEVTVVEVDDSIGTVILDSRRIEDSQDRMKRRYCYSSDLAWEGIDYAAPDTIESKIIKDIHNAKLMSAIEGLTETQQRRLWMLANGMSLREIAREEGVDHKAVSKSIEQARKKIKEILKNFQ